MKKRQVSYTEYSCDYCGATYKNKDKCNKHEKEYCLYNKKIKWNFWKLTKTFQGGDNYCYIASLKKEFTDKEWEFICEDVGEGTDGGHSYGYQIEWKKVRRPKEKELKENYYRISTTYRYTEEILNKIYK